MGLQTRLLSLRLLTGIWKELFRQWKLLWMKQLEREKPVKLLPFSTEGKLRNMTYTHNLENQDKNQVHCFSQSFFMLIAYRDSHMD